MTTRRQAMKWLASGAAAATLLPKTVLAAGTRTVGKLHTRAIPATGEEIPVIGMGTARTFDVAGRRAEAAATGACRIF